MAEQHILIVDDEFNTRFAVNFALRNAGYGTAQAQSGSEALAILQKGEHPFHLVITDIQMPDMTGIELLDAMKATGIYLPVLVITGFGDRKTLIELIKRRCNAYLDKPFSPDELLAAVADIIRKATRTQQSLEGMQEKLLHSEKMNIIGNIVPQIAHEINNPAQVIQGVAQMLMADKTVDARTKNMASSIYDAAQSIVTLNRNLMELSKPFEKKLSVFSVEEPLERAIDFLTKAGVLKHCTILKDYQPGMSHITGDFVQLQQLFLNLLVNAAHAMNECSAKTVSVGAQHLTHAQQVVISIADTGCGIPLEHIETIFEPYFTTRQAAGGTGLGLAVAKQIVEGHKGTIAVASEPGRGTTFTISLPARYSQAGAYH